MELKYTMPTERWNEMYYFSKATVMTDYKGLKKGDVVSVINTSRKISKRDIIDVKREKQATRLGLRDFDEEKIFQVKKSDLKPLTWRNSKTRKPRDGRNLFLSIAACKKDQFARDMVTIAENLAKMVEDKKGQNFRKQMYDITRRCIKDDSSHNDPQELTVTCSNDQLDVDSFNLHTLLLGNFFDASGSLKKDYTLGTSTKMGERDGKKDRKYKPSC